MNEPQVRERGDIANALSVGMQRGGLMLDESQLGPGFFDLSSGFAGEVLQKFTNYRVRLAIVVADAKAYGPRFSELVYEHRSHGAVRFLATEQLARQWLAYNPVVRC